MVWFFGIVMALSIVFGSAGVRRQGLFGLHSRRLVLHPTRALVKVLAPDHVSVAEAYLPKAGLGCTFTLLFNSRVTLMNYSQGMPIM